MKSSKILTLVFLFIFLFSLSIVEAVEESKDITKGFALEYFLVSLSGLLVLAMFFYFLYRKYLSYKSEEFSPKLPRKTEKEENRWYDFLRPQIPGKIRHLKYKRKHKVEDKKHHDFFTEFGKETKKIDNRLFNKIRRMAKYNKRTEKVFQNLEEVTKLMKEKEKKLLEKKEIKNSISKLKEMFKKS